MNEVLKKLLLVIVAIPFFFTGYATAGSSLFDAVQLGEHQQIQDLLSKGADINAQNEKGMTPLILASAKGDIRTVKLLLNHGASVNKKASYNITAIWIASALGHASL